MWLSTDHRGIRVYVRGSFVAPQQWLIQATVANESGVGKSKGSGDLQRTLAELWQGIMLESRVGRRRGAVTVRIVVDGDQEIAALFAETEKTEGLAVALAATPAATALQGSGDELSGGPVAVR